MTRTHPKPSQPSPEETKRRYRARMRRLRVVWFTFGCLMGLLCSLMITAVIDAIEEQQEEEIAAAGVSLEEAEAEGEESTDEPAPEPITWPQYVDFTVGEGDTLAGILNDHGITPNAAYNVIESMQKTFDPRKLRGGHKLHMVLDKDESRSDDPEATILNQLSIYLNKLETVNIYARPENPSNYRVEKEVIKLSTSLGYAEGIIAEGSSLAAASTAQGVPNSIITNLIKAFSFDIDFQRSIKAGDAFEIYYEKLVMPDGTTVKGGDVMYALLKTGGKTHKIYYYEDNLTPGKFYNEKGESIVKTLLRTPVDGARISSGFGHRRHPILKYSRLHTGIDFAAPRGTNIYAAGDGVITYAGRKGGYGNYISIKHNGTYTTAYAHANGFARGIKSGKHVRQGQVIAYVGTTGRSTGPHLHYEIIKNGKKINPNTVQFLNSGKLSRKQLALFEETKSRYTRKIAELKRQTEIENRTKATALSTSTGAEAPAIGNAGNPPESPKP